MEVREIHTGERSLDADDDLSGLVEHIRKYGQKRPVLVDAEMNLIDGYRRMMAQRIIQSGDPKVHVIMSDNLEDSCEVLNKNRLYVEKLPQLARPLMPKRIWEIYMSLYRQMLERRARIRARRTGMARSETLPLLPRSRNMIAEAMGFQGEGALAVATALYRTFTADTTPERHEGLAAIRAKVESGEMTMYEAKGAVDRLGKSDLGGDIVSVQGQRDALSTAVAQLAGTVNGLTRIGEINSGITVAEIKMYVKGLEDAKRELQRFVQSLRKRASE